MILAELCTPYYLYNPRTITYWGYRYTFVTYLELLHEVDGMLDFYYG